MDFVFAFTWSVGCLLAFDVLIGAHTQTGDNFYQCDF